MGTKKGLKTVEYKVCKYIYKYINEYKYIRIIRIKTMLLVKTLR